MIHSQHNHRTTLQTWSRKHRVQFRCICVLDHTLYQLTSKTFNKFKSAYRITWQPVFFILSASESLKTGGTAHLMCRMWNSLGQFLDLEFYYHMYKINITVLTGVMQFVSTWWHVICTEVIKLCACVCVWPPSSKGFCRISSCVV